MFSLSDMFKSVINTYILYSYLFSDIKINIGKCNFIGDELNAQKIMEYVNKNIDKFTNIDYTHIFNKNFMCDDFIYGSINKHKLFTVEQYNGLNKLNTDYITVKNLMSQLNESIKKFNEQTGSFKLMEYVLPLNATNKNSKIPEIKNSVDYINSSCPTLNLNTNDQNVYNNCPITPDCKLLWESRESVNAKGLIQIIGNNKKIKGSADESTNAPPSVIPSELDQTNHGMQLLGNLHNLTFPMDAATDCNNIKENVVVGNSKKYISNISDITHDASSFLTNYVSCDDTYMIIYNTYFNRLLLIKTIDCPSLTDNNISEFILLRTISNVEYENLVEYNIDDLLQYDYNADINAIKNTSITFLKTN